MDWMASVIGVAGAAKTASALAPVSVGFLSRRKSLDADGLWRDFMERIREPYDASMLLSTALNVLADSLPGDSYYAYAGEEGGSGLLRLKVTRTASGTPSVGPNYAGLVAGAPVRRAPLDIPRPDQSEVYCDETGGDLSVNVPVGRSVLLRASGGRRAPSSRDRAGLIEFARRLAPLMVLAGRVERLTEETHQREMEQKLQRRAWELAMRIEAMLGLIGRLGQKALHVEAGCLTLWQPGQDLRIVWEEGDGRGLLEQLDPRPLYEAVKASGPYVWAAPDLPGRLSVSAYQSLAYVPVKGFGEERGALLLGSHGLLGATPGQDSVLKQLAVAVSQILEGQALSQSASARYLRSLMVAADLLDAADPYNEGHSRQVAAVAVGLAQRLRFNPEEVRAMEIAGRLHDIGMIAVDLGIPLTPGTISESMRELLQQHPDLGADLLTGLSPSVVPPIVESAIRYHHERWDGVGYPRRLKGRDIPREARVMACAEVFVARLSRRSYRAGLPVDKALYEVSNSAGSQLDPEVVEALLALYREHGVAPAGAADRSTG